MWEDLAGFYEWLRPVHEYSDTPKMPEGLLETLSEMIGKGNGEEKVN